MAPLYRQTQKHHCWDIKVNAQLPFKKELELGITAQVFNPSILEAEVGISLWLLGQPGLHSEFQDSQSSIARHCLQKEKNNNNKKQKTKKHYQHINTQTKNSTFSREAVLSHRKILVCSFYFLFDLYNEIIRVEMIWCLGSDSRQTSVQCACMFGGRGNQKLMKHGWSCLGQYSSVSNSSHFL